MRLRQKKPVEKRRIKFGAYRETPQTRISGDVSFWRHLSSVKRRHTRERTTWVVMCILFWVVVVVVVDVVIIVVATPSFCSLTSIPQSGNTPDGTPANFTWTLPHFPSGKAKRCALRIRYNVSTDDYHPFDTGK